MSLPAELEAGFLRGRHSQRSPLPCQRDVSQRRWAAAWWELLSSGHPPACGNSSLLCPVPGQASIRSLQRASAHLPLLHERPVFGGGWVAVGRSARVFWPQTAIHQKLATRATRLRQYPGRGTFLKSIKLEKRTSPGWIRIKTLLYKWAAEQMIHVSGCHYLLIDICICSWNLHLHWSPDSTNIVFFMLTFVSRFKLLYINEPSQRFTQLLLMQLSCQNKVSILISFQIVKEIRFALLVSPICDFKPSFSFRTVLL